MGDKEMKCRDHLLEVIEMGCDSTALAQAVVDRKGQRQGGRTWWVMG